MTAWCLQNLGAWRAGCRQPAGRRTDGANSGIRWRTADAIVVHLIMHTIDRMQQLV